MFGERGRDILGDREVMKVKSGTEKETALGIQRREGAEAAERVKHGVWGGREEGGREGFAETGTWGRWGDSSGTRSPEAAGGEAEEGWGDLQ